MGLSRYRSYNNSNKQDFKDMSFIPDKERQEWRDLLTGQINVKLQNFVLQMQVDQTKRAIQNSKMTIEEGIDKTHALCKKYAMAVKSDIKTLFNQ